MAKTVKDLTAQEVLALAIQAEEEDGRIYADLAQRIRGEFPETGKSLQAMHGEENGHRHRLIELYRSRFGEHIPLIRRQDIKGFISRKPLWVNSILTVAMIRREVETMERESRTFYQAAIAQTSDAAVRQLLGDLAAEEAKHYVLAESMDEQQKTSGARDKEDESERRRFVLQVVQPGLAGLMDGSVSTLAPVFAAAFASHNSWTAFLVGMAASIGAGISMGFAEALSDDGVLNGRGQRAGDAVLAVSLVVEVPLVHDVGRRKHEGQTKLLRAGLQQGDGDEHPLEVPGMVQVVETPEEHHSVALISRESQISV